MIISTTKTLPYEQCILKLNKKNESVLLFIKTIYNNFKDIAEKESEKKFNNNEAEFTKLLEKTIILDKAKWETLHLQSEKNNYC